MKKKITALMAFIVLVAGFLYLQPAIHDPKFEIPKAEAAGIFAYSEAIPGLQMMQFHLSGAYSTTKAAVVKFNIPYKAELLQVQTSCYAHSGTAPTLDVLEGGSSVLSAVITMTTAGIVYEGTISDASLAKDGVITMNLWVGTTVTDVTVILTLRRTN